MKSKEEIREYKRQWSVANKEKIKQYIINSKQQRRKLKLKHYGITPEQYNEIFNRQKGKCAICGKPQTELKKRLHIDHNHITGEIRGLLCFNCNLILGMSNDNSEQLRNAADYLDKKTIVCPK
jgi:hypothetical protein